MFNVTPFWNVPKNDELNKKVQKNARIGRFRSDSSIYF